MKYTKVQEKGRVSADIKIKGEKGITQLFTKSLNFENSDSSELLIHIK